jgi:hypothetical protein
MNRKEAFEFLELPESASDAELKTRLLDKLAYFERLSENAPNDFLRKLHLQNIEKVKTIQKNLLQETVSAVQPFHRSAASSFGDSSSQQTVRHSPVNTVPSHSNQNPVAWLVRHTENQSAKTFPLYPGKNVVGRTAQTGMQMILLDDDGYVSRVHAVVTAENGEFFITDNATSNGGKASKNGTYINGNDNRITQKVKLRENDTIQLGMTKLILRSNNTTINKIVHEVEESDYMKTVVIDIF